MWRAWCARSCFSASLKTFGVRRPLAFIWWILKTLLHTYAPFMIISENHSYTIAATPDNPMSGSRAGGRLRLISLFRRQRRHEYDALPNPPLQRLVRCQTISGNHNHAVHSTTGEIHFARVWLGQCRRILFRTNTDH